MSDRELLELAAKAAGIRINHWIYDDLDYSAAVLETGEVWHLLRYDLDAAGISNREKEALELVELRAENERLREALAWAYNLRHLRGHSDPVVIPERFAPFIEAALRREDKA